MARCSPRYVATSVLQSRPSSRSPTLEMSMSSKDGEVFTEMHRRFCAAVNKLEVSDARDMNVIKNNNTQILAITSTGCARNRKLLRGLKPNSTLRSLQ